VRLPAVCNKKIIFAGALLSLWAPACFGQQASKPSSPSSVPSAAGARILLLPKKLVSGERATLAVLDLSGRLTPGVKVDFSNGDTVTTDASGRALFVAPLNLAAIYGSIAGRAGKVASTIVGAADSPGNSTEVELSPRVVSLNDRLEVSGHGFCGDANANRVTMGGLAGLVIASSPAFLAVVPSPEQEHREVAVRIKGSTAKLRLEARNLAADVADLQGGEKTLRMLSTGGPENLAKFELIGKKNGSFVISIRLVAPPEAPQR
jgi:hypothetical protein